MSALGEALGALGRDLQDCGVPYALVGGLAVSVRTEPRFTRDIDVVATVAALLHAATDDERAAVDALLPRVRSARGTPPEQLVQLWRGVWRG